MDSCFSPKGIVENPLSSKRKRFDRLVSNSLCGQKVTLPWNLQNAGLKERREIKETTQGWDRYLSWIGGTREKMISLYNGNTYQSARNDSTSEPKLDRWNTGGIQDSNVGLQKTALFISPCLQFDWLPSAEPNSPTSSSLSDSISMLPPTSGTFCQSASGVSYGFCCVDWKWRPRPTSALQGEPEKHGSDALLPPPVHIIAEYQQPTN